MSLLRQANRGGEVKTESIEQEDAEPPSNPKPGDTWGAYVLHEDGWWRLIPKKRKRRTKP